MDDLRIRVDPPNERQGNLVIKVLINGRTVTEDDYCLDVDSFFSALSMPESEVSLVGGCGEPGCCGTGYQTFATSNCWRWVIPSQPPDSPPFEKFRFSWADVYSTAKLIISEVERLAKDGMARADVALRLPFYRQVLLSLRQKLGIAD
jgi:hypothetical protein